MIRYLFLLLSLVVLSSTKCNHDKTSTPPGTTTTTTPAAAAVATVYITTTGTKYHNGNCRSVKKSKISISLPDAVAKGYEPCGVCHPPVADSLPE
jgi:hypothetical protein